MWHSSQACNRQGAERRRLVAPKPLSISAVAGLEELSNNTHRRTTRLTMRVVGLREVRSEHGSVFGPNRCGDRAHEGR